MKVATVGRDRGDSSLSGEVTKRFLRVGGSDNVGTPDSRPKNHGLAWAKWASHWVHNVCCKWQNTPTGRSYKSRNLWQVFFFWINSNPHRNRSNTLNTTLASKNGVNKSKINNIR